LVLRAVAPHAPQCIEQWSEVMPIQSGAAQRLVLMAAITAFLVLGLQPAMAGGYRVEPGVATRIDTGERSNYTTVTIINRGNAPGQLTIDAPTSRVIAVPAGGQVELYEQYGRSTIGISNTGTVPLQVVTRYMETPRLP
jgi:hypothetical protein